MANRNIIIYSVNPQSVHLATDIELAAKFKSQGEKVTIIRCTGQLKSCLVNPLHNGLLCITCKDRYRKAIQQADITDVRILSLPESGHPSEFYEGIPKEFKDIRELKAFKFQGADAGVAVASTLIGRLNRDHQFDTKKYHKEVYRELQMWVDTFLGLSKLIEEINPDEVYFFNGRFSSLHPLMSICIGQSIPYYTHERAGVMNKYIVRKNAMPHNIDYSTIEINEIWDKGDEGRERTGAKFYTDRRNNVIQSWVSYTESQAKGSLPEGFDRAKKNIAIFNSTIEEYEGMAEWQNSIYADENDGIDQLLKSFKNNDRFQFYLRVHPNLKLLDNSQARRIKELASQHANLHLIRPEAELDSYSLMDNVDKVITFGSTMGAESTFWGKPSILMGKAIFMGVDVVYVPSHHQEAVDLIKEDNLSPKDRINSIKYGYWELTKGIYFEKFQQKDLFTMAIDGKIIEPGFVLRTLEKLPKLALIRGRRGWYNVIQKLKGTLGWK